jgi:hypothetical protein
MVAYLQTEINRDPCRAAQCRRLKLSNLLQLDRFKEDLHISRVNLSSSISAPSPPIWQRKSEHKKWLKSDAGPFSSQM